MLKQKLELSKSNRANANDATNFVCMQSDKKEEGVQRDQPVKMSELEDFVIPQIKLNATESSEGTWTTARIKLLLKERFSREHDFTSGQKKKSFLWNSILRDIKASDAEFPFMPHEMKTKFYNLLTTYKRVKRRKGKTDWKYYELFNNVYGEAHFMDELPSICAEALLQDEETPEAIYDLDKRRSAVSPISQRKNAKQKPKKSSKILGFLKYQEKQEERRHRELLAIKQRKVDVEVQKLQALLDMQNLLRKAMLNQGINGAAEFVIKAGS